MQNENEAGESQIWKFVLISSVMLLLFAAACGLLFFLPMMIGGRN